MDAKEQLEEAKSSSSLIMNAFDFPMMGNVDENEIKELEEKYEIKIQTQKAEFTKTQTQLQQQIESLTEYNSQVDFQMKIEKDTHKCNVKSLEEKMSELEAFKT